MSNLKNKYLNYIDLGLIDYRLAWDFQEELLQNTMRVKKMQREGHEIKSPNYLIFCEHKPVFTLGKSGEIDNLLVTEEELNTRNISFYKINRGGDITYHGPGQLVGYPILDLENFFTDIHQYLRLLEETIILTLAEYGITAGRFPGYTGVWIDADKPGKERKICAMGVRCSRWITMHGWALNVNNSLDNFNLIVPCGIKEKQVTSMFQELGKEVEMTELKKKLYLNFCKQFEVKAEN